jgi:sugar O-acyltransferase (sialic acid O-acetyltransferase NeuD family)
MEKTDYLIYGGGSHSRVVISILEKMGIQIAGIFDTNNRLKKIKKIPFLGRYDAQIDSNCKLVIAVGDNDIRKKISEVIQHPIGTIIDPDTMISEEVLIGEGTQIITSSTVNVGTKIGKHCIINTNSSIDHDCKIYDFVHIAPGVTICGGVSVGKSTLVGAGTTILPNVNVGENVIIGAGSLVNKDIPDNSKALGSPAKIIENEKK